MKTILVILLTVQVLTQTTLLVSSPTTVTIPPPGTTTVQNVVNIPGGGTPISLSYGASWIFDNAGGVGEIWPAGYTVTFQALFDVNCPNAPTTLHMASSLSGELWINGVSQLLVGLWSYSPVAMHIEPTVSITLKGGQNNITFVLTKGPTAGHTAIIFAVTQDQTCQPSCNLSPIGYFNDQKGQCDCLGITDCPKKYPWSGYPDCACQCPSTTCVEGMYLHLTNCKCQCKVKTCPSGQTQDPYNCGCGQQN